LSPLSTTAWPVCAKPLQAITRLHMWQDMSTSHPAASKTLGPASTGHFCDLCWIFQIGVFPWFDVPRLQLKNIFSAPFGYIRVNFEHRPATAHKSASQTNQACSDKTPLKPNAGVGLRSQIAWC
jgi:hypothetical protein